MAKHKKPLKLDWKRTSTDTYFMMPGQKCTNCPHIFGKNEPVWRAEQGEGWFRGDDSVWFSCIVCGPRLVRP